MMKQKTAIVVPVRLEATRFPRKPLFKIRGKPLILWVAERIAGEAPEMPLYFAVEEETVEGLLEKRGYRVIMTASDHPSGTDRIAEANEMIGADYLINIQGDEPMVTARQIKTLENLIQGPSDMATLAVPFKREEDFHDPDKVKVVLGKGNRALYFSRSPIPYAREHRGFVDSPWLQTHPCYQHLGMYAYTREFLCAFQKLPPGELERIEKLEQLRALENGYAIAVGLSEEPTLGIDTPEDAAAFEQLLS